MLTANTARQAVETRRTAQRRRSWAWYKPVVFLLALVPFTMLIWSVVNGTAGPNPIEYLEKQTGEWSLRFLLLTLAMTPLSQILHSVRPVQLRRMIGLFAFFYVTVHLLIYIVLDQSLALTDIFADVFKRPFVTAGLVAWLIMLPLAVTSTKGMIRRLGRRWKALHSWVYFAGVAAVLHYVWLAKGDRLEPVVYLLILIVLLSWRMRAILTNRSSG